MFDNLVSAGIWFVIAPFASRSSFSLAWRAEKTWIDLESMGNSDTNLHPP